MDYSWKMAKKRDRPEGTPSLRSVALGSGTNPMTCAPELEKQPAAPPDGIPRCFEEPGETSDRRGGKGGGTGEKSWGKLRIRHSRPARPDAAGHGAGRTKAGADRSVRGQRAGGPGDARAAFTAWERPPGQGEEPATSAQRRLSNNNSPPPPARQKSRGSRHRLRGARRPELGLAGWTSRGGCKASAAPAQAH